MTAPRPVTPLGVAAATLTRVRAALAQVEGIDADLLAELDDATATVAGLEPYVESVTSAASEPLKRLAEQTAAQDWVALGAVAGTPGNLEQEMISGHVEGRFLEFLIRLARPRSVLEIGMFTGYSALAMAEALAEVSGPQARVVACELDPEVAELARRLMSASPVGDQVQIEVGPALETLERLAADGASFDFVFLDADKPGYLGYLDALLDTSLLARGGFVAVDNTLMQGEPWSTARGSVNGTAIADFNTQVAADPRVVQVVVPIRDGVTLLRRC